MKKRRKIFVIEFPGVYLGGVCVVKAYDKVQALEMANEICQSNSVNLDDLDESNFTINEIKHSENFIYFYNGDY